jgi:hypothetical protein
MVVSGTAVGAAPTAPAEEGCPPGVPRVLAEAAVLVGGACLLLHLVAVVAQRPRDVALVAVLLAMAAVCAPCLRALWAGPTRRDWAVTGAMYGGMLLTHLCWFGVGSHGGHVHGAGGLSWGELAMWGGLALAGVQTALSAACLLLLASAGRHARPPSVPR